MESRCRDTVVTTLMGGIPSAVPERYREVSATAMLPLQVPQILIWGEHEEFVPLPLAQRHVEKSTEAGDKARLIIGLRQATSSQRARRPPHGPRCSERSARC